MAAIKFIDPNGIIINRRFGAPKSPTLRGWFNAARKACKSIPSIKMGWIITHQSATLEEVKFTLSNGNGATIELVIDRTAPSM